MPLLVGFTIPLVLGNLFQLTYNAVDSIIVGQFVGKEALAAVGICNPVMTLMILFLNGLCMGASILMGTQFGAKDYNKLQRQISTTKGLFWEMYLPKEMEPTDMVRGGYVVIRVLLLQPGLIAKLVYAEVMSVITASIRTIPLLHRMPPTRMHSAMQTRISIPVLISKRHKI